jgi:GPH family glycoside/pentoside/hexuronide:cation symporter
VIWFAVVCITSGAVLGADLTLLPAMFATRLAKISPSAAEGFGLWSFVSKLTLAIAAVALLPMLEAAGLQTGTTQSPPDAVQLLVILYAGLPCALKLIAIVLLSSINEIEEA